MNINGVYYTEPELAAKLRQMQETIDRYEAENRKLTAEKEELGGLYNDASLGIGYLEQRCEELETREKEYKRLLKAAVGTLNDSSCGKDCHQCKWNDGGCEMNYRFTWIHTDEANELIGETND